MNAAEVYLSRLTPSGQRGAHYTLRIGAKLMAGNPCIKAFDWGSMDRRMVVTLMATMASQYSPNTTGTLLSLIKQVAFEANQLGDMDDATYQAISTVKRGRGSRVPPGRALSKEEVRQAIDTCREEGTLKGARDAVLIAIGTGCGLRCDELRHLHTRDVGEQLRVLGKGNKEALQPIPAIVRELLDDYLSELPEGPLLPRWLRNDTPSQEVMSNAGVYHIVRRRLTDASPHDMRRTYATWLESAGHSMTVIQRLMRHSSPVTTMRYVRNEEAATAASQTITF